MAVVKLSNCGHDENGRYAGGKPEIRPGQSIRSSTGITDLGSAFFVLKTRK